MRLVLLYSVLGRSSAYTVISTNKIFRMKKNLVTLYRDMFNLLCIISIFQNSIKLFSIIFSEILWCVCVRVCVCVCVCVCVWKRDNIVIWSAITYDLNFCASHFLKLPLPIVMVLVEVVCFAILITIPLLLSVAYIQSTVLIILIHVPCTFIIL